MTAITEKEMDSEYKRGTPLKQLKLEHPSIYQRLAICLCF